MKAVADTLEVSRSRQNERKKQGGTSRKRYYEKAEDDGYLALIRQVADDRPTYGYRRVTALINRYLMQHNQRRVNPKRIYRLMKMHKLLLQRHTGRPVRLHEGAVMTKRSNLRWCSDAFEIACWNGDRVRVAFSMDCCDREVMSYIATTGGISGDMVRDMMVEAIEDRFGRVDHLPHRIQWLSDNAPAYIARETKIFARMMGLRHFTALNRMEWLNPLSRLSKGTMFICIT